MMSGYSQLLVIIVGYLQYLPAYLQEVVVVGGGVSGLAAASHLCRNKLCNLTVLEAEDRVGGRLFTDRFHGELVERGAQWMHGIKGNPVYWLVSRNYSVEVDEWSGGGTIKLSSGVKPPGEEIRRLVTLAEELYDDLAMKVSKTKRPITLKDTILYSEARALWQEQLASHDITVDPTITDAIFHYTMTEWSLETGELSHNVSALTLLYYRILEGGDILIPQGYSVLLDILQNDIPEAAIQLGKRVTRIVWKDGDNNNPTTSKVKVEYTERDGSIGQIDADHVIVTVSIAVLQKYHRTMLVPNLSNQQARAIEKLRLGVVNKIFLYYQRKFWNERTFPMYLLWDSDIRAEFAQDAHWFRDIDFIETYGETMLMVWANAHVSREIQDLSNEEIGRRLTILIRSSLANDSIPYPDDTLVTRWHTDENFLGSYSYKSLGQTKVTSRIARRPLSVNGIPKVLFAGEATHLSRFGTIDGAYRTGVREAKRVLQFHPA